MEWPEVPCKKCKQMTAEIALFPGGICLKCYEQTAEAKAPLTDGREVLRMFGKSVKA